MKPLPQDWEPGRSLFRRWSELLLLQLAAPAVIGLVTGACVAACSLVVEHWAVSTLASLPGAMPALFSPLALLVTLAVTTWITRVSRPSTSELYLWIYHGVYPRVPLRELPGRVLAAATTVMFGGSQGLESPSALIGASVGDVLGGIRRLRLGAEDQKTLLVAGASAGLAAVFSSPAVGALYGIEIPFKRDADVPRLIPSTIAACCGYGVRAWLIGSDHLVSVQESPRLDGAFLLGCGLVAVLCGLGARLFARSEEWLHQLTRRSTPLRRAIMAGLTLAALAWSGHALTGAWITFGPGYLAADWLAAGSHPLWLLVVAMLIRTSGTLTCVYGGGGGGVFTSLACTGIFVGQIVAELVSRTETRVLPLLGAACFLGSGYRLPLACMLFIAEESGDMTVSVVGLFAIGIGQVLMGNDSVSDNQKDTRAH